ncbi:MAG TPA: ABC transporter [Spirochaetaceae bacterium]|nr:ABC transporter [Spirochaetaceae bacterium]
MLKLIRYLKPYLLTVAIIVVLLFVQANMDLALPDYLSRIVNVGIQQGGVDSPFPKLLRAAELERLSLFLDETERGQVKSAYRRYGSGDPEFAALAESLPAIGQDAILILTSDDRATLQAIRGPLSRALAASGVLRQLAANPLGQPDLPSIPGLDLTRLPAGLDLLDVLARLPADQSVAIKQAVLAQLDGLGDGMVEQAAIRAVRAEYAALGLDLEKLQTGYIVQTGLLMLALTLGSALVTILIGLLASRTAAGIARALRRDVFRTVVGFSGAEFDQFSTASLITRSTNDVTQVQMVIFMLLRMVIYAPIMGGGGFIRAMGKAPSMGWIIGLAVLVMLALIVVVFIIAMPKFRSIQKLVDRLNLVARENLTGLMVVRAFNRQPFEERRFDGANQELTSVNLFVNRVMVVMMPVMMLVMNLLSIAVIWVGAHQIAESAMQVGDMMAFLQYTMQIVMSFLMLSMVFIFLPRASVSGDRIAEVLRTRRSVKDPGLPVPLPPAQGARVEFRDVSFRYPGADSDVLCNISFTAEPGQTTAIIGPTGSGKSTIVNLIPRFYDVTAGVVLVDGVDVRAAAQADLRDRIGYVPQKATLFSGTVASNLRYGLDAADKVQLAEAVAAAQAADFVNNREGGYEATVSQGGANLSGGQKQRIAIARAFITDPRILILDDSTSAVDSKTEDEIQRAMKRAGQGRTTFLITHRLAQIRRADRILLLEAGRLAASGSHDELMDSSADYRRLFEKV